MVGMFKRCSLGTVALCAGLAVAQPAGDRADTSDVLSALHLDSPAVDAALESGVGAEVSRLASQLREVGGASLEQTTFGVLAVASGQGFYDAGALDTKQGEIDRRMAQLDALSDAKRAMARLLGGSSMRGELVEALEIERRDGLDDGGAVATEEIIDSASSASSALLRGAAVFAIEDRPDLGEVIVTLVSSPSSRDVVGAGDLSGTVISAPIDVAMERIRAELELGLLPPAGARVCRDPRTGDVAWIGIGGEPLDPSSGIDGVVGKRIASENAELTARRHLVAALTGEQVETRSEFERRSVMKDMELSRVGGVDGSESETLSMMRERSNARVEGEIPAGSVVERFASDDGVWRYAMVVWVDRAPTTASRAAPVERVSASSEVAARDRVAQPSEDACGDDRPEEGIYPRLAVGTGSTRNEAVRDAIGVALFSVNGGYLKDRSTVETRYTQAVTEMDSSLSRESQIDRMSDARIEQTTEGMLAGFDVLEARVADGLHEVTLCVRVRRYDKTMRAMKPAQILLLPGEAKQGMFTLYEERVDGDDAMELLARELTPRLNSSRFSVIEQSLLADADRVLEDIRRDVAAGRMVPDELASVGRRLGAEYVCVPTLYKLEGDLERRSPGGVTLIYENLSVRLGVTVVDVATGQSLSPESVSIAWEPREMKALRDRGEIVDQLTFALDQASNEMAFLMLGQLDRHEIENYFIPPEQAAATILRGPETPGGRARVLVGPVEAQSGDELDVFRLDRELIGGRLELVPTWLGRVRMGGVFPGSRSATVEILEGSVEVGAVCVPAGR